MHILNFFLLFGITNAYFLNFKFGNPFLISNNEITKKILYDKNDEKLKILEKINGFYGMIGPSINMENNKNKTLFDLFTQNGVINGIFFNNGEITYIRNYIRTDKLLYEELNGKIPNNLFIKFIFFLLEKIKLLPNLLGLANTSFLKIKNKIYVLYERDLPYLIHIDFENYNIQTLKKTIINGIENFSAHSKYNSKDNIIETIDYNIYSKNIIYSCFDESLKIKNSKKIKMDYLPIVHDFISTDKNIIITDSPLLLDFSGFFRKTFENFFVSIFSRIMGYEGIYDYKLKNKFPVIFDKNKFTKIHILDKNSSNVKTYICDDSFFIFHYANVIEDDDKIEIFASIYDNLDLSKINNKAFYRKIIIDKNTKNVKIEKNIILENYNLDFPIKFNDKIILQNFENSGINGFLICENLNIKKNIFLENKYICGESTIILIDSIYYLLSFAYDYINNNESYLILINLDNNEIINIPLNEYINIGFHSIFINNTI
jgi:carotenoid cleavage dioxygenase-like enzyme